MATPHTGSHIADHISEWSLILPTVAVRELRTSASVLKTLQAEYRNLCCRIPSLCIQETKGIGSRSVLIVDLESSNVGIPGYEAIPVDEDHRTICKPRSTASASFVVSIRFIEGLYNPLCNIALLLLHCPFQRPNFQRVDLERCKREFFQGVGSLDVQCFDAEPGHVSSKYQAMNCCIRLSEQARNSSRSVLIGGSAPLPVFALLGFYQSLLLDVTIVGMNSDGLQILLPKLMPEASARPSPWETVAGMPDSEAEVHAVFVTRHHIIDRKAVKQYLQETFPDMEHHVTEIRFSLRSAVGSEDIPHLLRAMENVLNSTRAPKVLFLACSLAVAYYVGCCLKPSVYGPVDLTSYEGGKHVGFYRITTSAVGIL